MQRQQLFTGDPEVDCNSLRDFLVQPETVGEKGCSTVRSVPLEFEQLWSGSFDDRINFVGGVYTANDPVIMKYAVPASIYLHVRLSGKSRCLIEGGPEHATAAPEVQIWSVPMANTKIVNQPPNCLTRFVMYFLAPDSFKNLHDLLGTREGSAEDEAPSLITVPVPPSVRAALESAFSADVSQGQRDLYRQSKTTEALALLLDSINDLPTSIWDSMPVLRATDIEKIRIAAMHLRNRPDEAWSIPSLSREVCLNANKLQAGFRQVFGSTVFKYLLNVRMETGLMHLRTTDLGIAQIGYRAGFSSPSHFTHLFRERYGETPSSYRRRVLEEGCTEIREPGQ